MKTVAILALAALALAGCGRRGAESNSTKLVLHGQNGETAVIGKGAPSKMPAYAPLFPGAKITSSMDMGDKGGIVTYTVSAPPQAVIDFYKKAAAGAHFDSTMDMSNNPGAGAKVIMFSQTGSKRSLTASAEPSPDGTKVGLTYGTP